MIALIALIVCVSVVWWVVGVAGFVYWWTNEYDLDTGDLVFALVVGYLGPLSWIIGLGIHGHGGHPRILKRRRHV